MGAVACEKHGTHPGVLCCDHVRLASSAGAALIRFDSFEVDMIGDGTVLVGHLLCGDCAARFQLSASNPIASEVWESDDRFPYVCPACVQCLSEWQRRG